jgi:glycosyltransferase involved in cell wall biosynthesis
MTVVVHVVEATATGTLSMVCICANLQADLGLDVHVVYSPRPETPADLKEMFRGSVKLHALNMSGPAAIRAAWKLRRTLLPIRPDVFHLHSSFAGFIGRISALALPFRTRIFYSPHCISMMRRDINLRRYAYAMLERLACITDCTYLACSVSEQIQIRKWLGKDALLLENAIDFPISQPVSERMHASAGAVPVLSIVTVGGIRAQKSPQLFAEIARGCRRRNLRIELVWIGDGDEALVSELRDAGVTVTGWKPKQQIAGLLRSSSLYLSTARWEGLPVSIIEAMACGVPVLATRCAGNVDVIDHNRTGLLFDHANEAIDIIERMASGEQDLHAIAQTATAEARSRFSIERFTANLFAAYGISQPAEPTATVP